MSFETLDEGRIRKINHLTYFLKYQKVVVEMNNLQFSFFIKQNKKNTQFLVLMFLFNTTLLSLKKYTKLNKVCEAVPCLIFRILCVVYWCHYVSAKNKTLLLPSKELELLN